MIPFLLGDPHLGRKFTTGVPIHRRGEREQLVRDDFVAKLNPQGASVHICMGDLFDKPQVDYATVQFAYRAYRAAGAEHPGTTFYILQGNHDDSRDLAEVTAWDLFCDLVEHVPNVVPVTEPRHFGSILLMPWQPTTSAAEMLALVAPMVEEFGLTVAYGHWDTDPRGSAHNLIPTKELHALGVRTAFTGHVHKPDLFARDGIAVHVVGSMQPYAQGEDGLQSGDVRYETLTLEKLEEAMALGLTELHNSCVRLILQPGEQAPDTIPDCRSFAVERARPVEAAPVEQVSLEGFDTTRAAHDALDAHDIIPAVRSKIDTRWGEVFGAG